MNDLQIAAMTYGTPYLNLAQRIKLFHQGREAERLAIKYRLMRADAFAFMRGSCHLFYEDWRDSLYSINAPLAWICGDLHLENFGSFKGDNRLVYFDLNDFDEAVLAPATWELSRFMTSVLVAATTLNLRKKDALALCGKFLDHYAAALTEGKAKWVERKTAKGMIKDLLDPLRLRSRKAFLDSRTDLNHGMRRIRIDGNHAISLEDKPKKYLLTWLEQYASQQDNPQFYRPIDIARRVAGTGSLGIERYVILVEGNGSPDQNYLIDLKQAAPSALLPYLQTAQPAWGSEAERVVGIQKRVQAVSPALLQAVNLNGKSFLMKELQPSQDRLKLQHLSDNFKGLGTVIGSMGKIAAWGHLRSSGRQGSAIADAWIDFGEKHATWRDPLIELAQSALQTTLAEWHEYCHAYDNGKFEADAP